MFRITGPRAIQRSIGVLHAAAVNEPAKANAFELLHLLSSGGGVTGFRRNLIASAQDALSAQRLKSPGAGQFQLLGELAPLAGVGIGVILAALIDNFTSRITSEQDVQCTVLLARADNDDVLAAGRGCWAEVHSRVSKDVTRSRHRTSAGYARPKISRRRKARIGYRHARRSTSQGDPESEEFTARLR